MSFTAGSTFLESVSASVLQTTIANLRTSKILFKLDYTKGSETSITFKFSGYIDQDPGDDDAIEYKLMENSSGNLVEISRTVTGSIKTVFPLELPSRITKLRITISYTGSPDGTTAVILDYILNTYYPL